MKTVRDLIIFTVAGIFLIMGLLIIGCSAAPQPNPVERVEAPLVSGQAHVKAADAQLAKTPPAVPEARGELKQADKDLTQAVKETKAVKEEVGGILTKLVDKDKEIKNLKDSFFSTKQKHLFGWGIALTILLGVLAAIGDVKPGWWSLPALWAIKAVRFVLFSGIPHVVAAVRWLLGKFVKPAVATIPAPATLPA